MKLPKLLLKLQRSKAEPQPLLSPEQAAVLKATQYNLNKPLKPKPKGRVIKQTRHSEFNPDPKRSGGRIVKAMPRQLQKIKQGQEKFELDEQPKVEDLDDA